MMVSLSKLERRTLLAAIRRAVDWSEIDTDPNAKRFHGRAWAKREHNFIRRCRLLQAKLAEACK